VVTLDQLTPLNPRYPSRLRRIEDPPASITVRGLPLDANHAVAVVGARDATPEAAAFAQELARVLASTGAVVVSGGAQGIDAAAHRGALQADGRTWAVAATGHEHCCPPAHASLFEKIAQGPGAMVWPFAATYAHRSGFLARNRVLVALADAVVVVQAGFPSGALHAASWATKLQRPLWVVPAAPWMERFEGSRRLLDRGARPLTSIDALLASLDVVRPAPPEGLRNPPPIGSISPHEYKVLKAISSLPLHADAISALAQESAQVTAAALLTLALENVVVEGPPGFFRRRDAHNH
jgi:DNA processing protein